jgi:hypothetical protein
MAILQRVNGDLQPVAVMDAGSYDNLYVSPTNTTANAVVNGATVNAMGPKLDFFTIAAGGAVTKDEMAQMVLALQQLYTIYMYNADIATGDLVAALYPASVFDSLRIQHNLVNGTTLTTIQYIDTIWIPANFPSGGWAAATAAASATFV